MKKNYRKPLINIVTVGTTHMLAGSIFDPDAPGQGTLDPTNPLDDDDVASKFDEFTFDEFEEY